MEEYTKPVMRIINEEQRGEIYVSPSIMFHIQGSNITYLTVDMYLDSKDLCFDSITFEAFAWDFITFKQYIYTPDDYTWERIYDGDHRIIFVVTDSNGLTDEASVYFTRTQNPYEEGDETLGSITPAFGDCEFIKMATLFCARKNLSNTTISRTISINQFTSYGFYSTNDHFDGLFNTQHTQDYLGDYDNIIIKRGPRDNKGFLITPEAQYSERIYFGPTDDELKLWSWIKTTTPDGKILFISTTIAPADFIHPTAEIDFKMDGLTYRLRCLTQQEWMSIDEFTLDNIDFGNYMMNAWHMINTITRTKHTELDEKVFATTDEKNNYNSYLKGKGEENYVSMTYVSKAKAEALNIRSGWSEARPIRPDYDDKRSDVFWIPVLELINDPPVISFPDMDKENPVIYL